MKYLKKLYGKTTIDSSDSDEMSENNQIELEYYQVESKAGCKPYGIEIVKRNIENDILNIEEKTVGYLYSEKQDNNRLLEILMSNKVTPIAADDVIEDLLKMKEV